MSKEENNKQKAEAEGRENVQVKRLNIVRFDLNYG
jgi:hypothetical protein